MFTNFCKHESHIGQLFDSGAKNNDSLRVLGNGSENFG